MDVYMYTDVYIFFWNYGFLQVYVYACVYMEHIYMIIIHVCVYIYTHTHTHTMECLLSHKKEQNCVISRDVDGPRDSHTE